MCLQIVNMLWAWSIYRYIDVYKYSERNGQSNKMIVSNYKN